MHLADFKQFEYVLESLAALSVVTFGISLVCIPLLVARLPRNYFQRTREQSRTRTSSATPLALLILLLRNIAGLALFCAGIAMIFLPGQGIITIIIGIAIMSFPYKRRLLYTLTRPHSVRNTLDWIRKKMNKECFYW